MSDDTHAHDDELDCFTPGDNKIKIRKLNALNQNSFLNLPSNTINNNFSLIQDNKNISEFKTLEPLLYAQSNNGANPLYKLSEGNFASFLPQAATEIHNNSLPLDLSNYQLLL